MAASGLLADLLAAVPMIVPSLLAADLGDLRGEIRRLEEAGAGMFHLDIMDGHFVPNLSFGVPVVEAVRRATELPLDVHLMISDPAKYVRAFREAGANGITIHVEAVPDPTPLLEEIRGLGAYAGIAMNPPTPAEAVLPCLGHCDLVLTMSVMPGFGGQEFHPEALPKLRRLRAAIGDEALLSVDGGVNHQTIAACAEAGAMLFVVGTGLLGHPDYRRRLAELTALARSTYQQRAEPWYKSY